MKIAEKIDSLEENPPAEILTQLFPEVIHAISNSEIDIIQSLQIICELADKQWHTYEFLDPNIANLLDRTISMNFEVWYTDSEAIEAVLYLLGTLGGFEHSWLKLHDKYEAGFFQGKSSEILKEYFEENTTPERDPWHNTRQFKS